jgi:hypothetical protein
MTCHIWNGVTNRRGYGRVSISGALEFVHRHAYAGYHGLTMKSLKGVVIRHSCDNPSCANPLHLIAGTHADNMVDRSNRDRQAKGEGNGNAKLSEQDILAIRSDTRRAGEIAAAYRVHRRTVWRIKTGRNWTHVDSGEYRRANP